MNDASISSELFKFLYLVLGFFGVNAVSMMVFLAYSIVKQVNDKDPFHRYCMTVIIISSSTGLLFGASLIIWSLLQFKY